MMNERFGTLAAADGKLGTVLRPATRMTWDKPLRLLRHRRFLRTMQVVQFLLLMSGLVWLVYRGTEQMGYNWQWYRVPPYLFEMQDGRIVWGTLIFGLIQTIEISVYGLFLATFVGLCIALLRLSRSASGPGSRAAISS